MARRVRKQINIDIDQDQILKAEAARLGVSESAVVRRVLDAWIMEDAEARRQHAIARHEEIMRRIDGRVARNDPGRPYRFRREDAYDEEPRMTKYDDLT